MHFDIAPPAGYHPEIGLLVGALQDQTREWRDEIGEPDEDAIVWQPFPNSHSIGGLLLHIIEVEAWWLEVVGSGRKLTQEEADELMCDQIDQDNISWPTPPRKPISYYYELHDRYRARSLETLKSFDPEKVVEIEGSPWGHTYSLRWILSHVLTHESYHGGQAVFLRVLYEKTQRQS